jgi:phage shock protein PspC (stress-responsive transcriptional regulator)
MHCIHCGGEIADSSNFCSACGGRQRQRISQKQLTLSATDKKLAGVCGGIAEYLDVDPTIVRLIWVALSVVPGGFVGGALAYFLAWIIIPKAPAFASAPAGATTAQPSVKAG